MHIDASYRNMHVYRNIHVIESARQQKHYEELKYGDTVGDFICLQIEHLLYARHQMKLWASGRCCERTNHWEQLPIN